MLVETFKQKCIMKNSIGFTLIEVLVALAILGIALTAIIKSTAQNIKDTHYLQQKVIATWIATSIMNEARAELIKLSTDETSEEIEALQQTWIWKAHVEQTPHPKIQKIYVSIFHKNDEREMSRLTGYLYAQS